MKYLIFLSVLVFSITSCNVDVINHTHKAGDIYCSYNATAAGDAAFPVCIYCPSGSAMCGTIKEVRVLREHNWFTPNKYDHFTLTPTPGTSGCGACTGYFMWEKD